MAIKRNQYDWRIGEYHPQIKNRAKPALWHRDQQGIAARTLRKGGETIVCSTPERANWLLQLLRRVD